MVYVLQSLVGCKKEYRNNRQCATCQLLLSQLPCTHSAQNVSLQTKKTVENDKKKQHWVKAM